MKNVWVIKIEVNVKISKYVDLILFVSSLLKCEFIISKSSDWLGGPLMISTTIGFVFGSHSLKKMLSIAEMLKWSFKYM